MTGRLARVAKATAVRAEPPLPPAEHEARCGPQTPRGGASPASASWVPGRAWQGSDPFAPWWTLGCHRCCRGEQCRVARSVWTTVRGLDPGLKRAATDGGAGSLLGEESVWGPDAGRRRPPRRVGPCAAANVYFTSRDFHLHEKQQQLVPVMPRGASRTLGTTATKLPGPGAARGRWPCARRPEPGTELKSAAPRAGLGAEDGCPRPLFKLLDSEDLLISSEIVANFVSYFV